MFTPDPGCAHKHCFIAVPQGQRRRGCGHLRWAPCISHGSGTATDHRATSCSAMVCSQDRVTNAPGMSSKCCPGWFRAGMWKDLTTHTAEMKVMGASGREPRHVSARISWTRPPALGQGSHPSPVTLGSVDPSFLGMGLSPPPSFYSTGRAQMFLCGH